MKSEGDEKEEFGQKSSRERKWSPVGPPRAGSRRQPGAMTTVLTRVVPAQGRACDQKQKEAEERAASVRPGPTGRGHGAGRRWCAATGHSRTGTEAVEIRAQVLSDAKNFSRGEGTVSVHRASAAAKVRARFTSLPLRREAGPGERCWPRPLVRQGQGPIAGGGAKRMMQRCGRGQGDRVVSRAKATRRKI